jgi:hypothetical protein
MIDFSREYVNPELAVSGGGGNRRNTVIACGDGFDELKDKLANLSPSEAAELVEYLKTKGIE